MESIQYFYFVEGYELSVEPPMKGDMYPVWYVYLYHEGELINRYTGDTFNEALGAMVNEVFLNPIEGITQ